MDQSRSQPLDWQRVARALAGRSIGHRLVYRATTTSTNDVARDLAEHGAAAGVAVFAEEQTAGRGRAGKAPWLTPRATSIAVSVVLRPRLAPCELPRLSMAAAVAAVEAIRVATGVEATLKWPNDILAGTRKLGGVLVESAIAGSSVLYAVLGIGLNGNFPTTALGRLDGAAIDPTSLQDEAGRPISREALLIELLRALDARWRCIDSGDVAPMVSCYRSYLSTIGQPVRLLGHALATEGMAEDVTQNGELVIRLASGERRIVGHGEVSLRSAQAAAGDAP